MEDININGAILTDDILALIRDCQEDEEYFLSFLESIDNAVTFIASGTGISGHEKEALDVIGDLSIWKRHLRCLDGITKAN